MKSGDRVVVNYYDADGEMWPWVGVLKDQQADGRWRVEVGSVTFVFNADEIEVRDEKANEGTNGNQGRQEAGQAR
jgi:hypothetical protein